MELTPEQQTVLDIFKAHDIEEGEYLSRKTLERERSHFPQHIQDNWDNAIRSLIKDRYIFYDPLGYGLARKACCHIYPGYRDRAVLPVA